MAGHTIIGWLVIGLIVGAIAKLLTGERDASGCLTTIAIGIAGSLFAGWAGSHLFHLYRDGSNPGWLASILGAVVLIALVRVVNRR
jgi:uncharacterized membrane protein YeaQ/YmgE (transglycosylase-associated protein family)